LRHQRPIVTRDTLRETRHLRSTEIVWNVSDAEAKSTVPSKRDPVSQGKFPQGCAGRCRRKRWVCYQQLDIFVQIDRAMHLRFDLGT